jgi:isoleucyl-tRNA synthetase
MGDKLVGLHYNPPYNYYVGKIDAEKNFKVYHAEFVTDSDGTGIAHEAPEFGDVDFELAKTEWINITNALDNEGKYTYEIEDLKWIHYQEWNEISMARLKEMWKLFKKESINHRVAMCPRTATPLIYKVQDSWFIDIKNLKEKLIQENENINWFPEHLKHGQFLKSMESAPDWCISRTRYWGTPMPVWLGYDDKWEVKDTKVFGSRREIEEVSGMKIVDFHKPYIDDITWQSEGLTYKRIPEVLDVWLDSGSMPYAQIHYPFENKMSMEASYPADFIVEYIGQVRAWFYVMHVVGVALFW